MSAPIKFVAILTASAVILWLAGAFITLEFNPRGWTEFGRFVYVYSAFTGAVIANIFWGGS